MEGTAFGKWRCDFNDPSIKKKRKKCVSGTQIKRHEHNFTVATFSTNAILQAAVHNARIFCEIDPFS